MEPPPDFIEWCPDRFAKGLFLPADEVATWLIDQDGNPTHDQGAAAYGVDLVECTPLVVDPDGRVNIAFLHQDVAASRLDAALRSHDGRLWLDTSSDNEWLF